MHTLISTKDNPTTQYKSCHQPLLLTYKDKTKTTFPLFEEYTPKLIYKHTYFLLSFFFYDFFVLFSLFLDDLMQGSELLIFFSFWIFYIFFRMKINNQMAREQEKSENTLPPNLKSTLSPMVKTSKRRKGKRSPNFLSHTQLLSTPQNAQQINPIKIKVLKGCGEKR